MTCYQAHLAPWTRKIHWCWHPGNWATVVVCYSGEIFRHLWQQAHRCFVLAWRGGIITKFNSWWFCTFVIIIITKACAFFKYYWPIISTLILLLCQLRVPNSAYVYKYTCKNGYTAVGLRNCSWSSFSHQLWPNFCFVSSCPNPELCKHHNQVICKIASEYNIRLWYTSYTCIFEFYGQTQLSLFHRITWFRVVLSWSNQNTMQSQYSQKSNIQKSTQVPNVAHFWS